MLFETSFFVAGGIVVGLAVLDKTIESLGFRVIGNVLKVLIPLAGLAAGVYFIETNSLLHWIL
ncbi:hypothetical protein CVD25_06525 [Bacillus canaveralius]|uniref:Uncharacterized protein n=1 Tax=Bacillus canaveralius TaxID=1403243 RepID=A0A2N5GG44_9BACI|nr:hypothetical protein [Bacillus canaveralius]PLR79695.1 hypothetical protein CU635_21620 [Bacillus canaveralius]PLR99173.1 hypothetical protein CVD25_06525 [Bacillus canaveralius]